MTISEDQRRKVVEYLVFKVFASKANAKLSKVLTTYIGQLQTSFQLALFTGIKPEVPKVDWSLGDEYRDLVENILATAKVIENHNGDTKEDPTDTPPTS